MTRKSVMTEVQTLLELTNRNYDSLNENDNPIRNIVKSEDLLYYLERLTDLTKWLKADADYRATAEEVFRKKK